MNNYLPLEVGWDLHLEDEAFVWFRLVWDGEDLEIEHVGDAVNDPQPWWDFYTEEGFKYTLNLDYPQETFEGETFSIRWIQFALKHGIAPGQLFCMSLSRPYYSKHWTDCGYEYDCETETEVIALGPCRDPGKSWDRLLKRIQRTRRRAIDYKDRLTKAQWTDRKSMYLQSMSYFVDGIDVVSYDDYPTYHSGQRVLLSTGRRDLRPERSTGWGPALATGEDPTGQYDKALSVLAAKLVPAHPELNLDFLRTLPVRYTGW